MDYSFSGEVTTESNEQMTLLMDNLKDKKDNDRYNANKLLLLFDWNNNSTDKMVNDTMTQIRFNHSNTSLMLSPNHLIPDLINITQSTPLEYAMVMYGYIMPFLLLLTIVANTLIVLVLAQKHMRSPTNLVLLWMAVADMLTLVFPSPWYFYMYTLGYHRHVLHPTAACYIFNTMTDILPIAFHTASIWLTILLAGQRYVYICHPTAAKSWCTRPRVRRITIVLFAMAFVTQSTRFFDSKFVGVDFEWNGRREEGCRRLIADWVQTLIGANVYFPIYYGFRILFVNIGPCLALVMLNLLLFRALKRAQKKRQILFKDKKTSESKKVRDSNSTTYMLIVVVTVFLMVEIPLAVTTLIHILANMSVIEFADDRYRYLQLTIIISNFIIMLSFPLNFAIYCGMSQKFRITFNQLFVDKLLSSNGRQTTESTNNHFTHTSMSTTL